MGNRPADTERANNYYRARYYDPKIGRFISEDPIQWAGGNNFYAYVENNPINFIDPEGLVKGERGQTGKPGGTADEYKKMKPHPTDPNKVKFKDPHTGKEYDKPKPPGFQPWWDEKHGKKMQSVCESDPGMCAAAATAGGIAIGYVTYRCLRMVPSLFPPLWPTIPANVVIP